MFKVKDQGHGTTHLDPHSSQDIGKRALCSPCISTYINQTA